MSRKVFQEGIAIIIIAISSFFLAHNFYNDPLLKGGPALFDIPLYIIILFFILLYISYRITFFVIKMVGRRRKIKR